MVSEKDNNPVKTKKSRKKVIKKRRAYGKSGVCTVNAIYTAWTFWEDPWVSPSSAFLPQYGHISPIINRFKQGSLAVWNTWLFHMWNVESIWAYAVARCLGFVYILQFMLLHIPVSSSFLLKPAENSSLLTRIIHAVLTFGSAAKPVPWYINSCSNALCGTGYAWHSPCPVLLLIPLQSTGEFSQI